MAKWGWGYPEYVPVAEKKRRAMHKLEQLRKKNSAIQPVIIQGPALVRTWWGKAWNTNLERYADFHNRIGRGKDYVRHGAVLDLQIEKGCIAALVQGSRSKPYKVAIQVKTLQRRLWQEITAQCAGELESLQELTEGLFPKALGEIFLGKDTGLFPSPREISFDCSCPDWASMCKHVAATLYGIGVRLDNDPLLFFTFRGVDVQELIRHTVIEKTTTLLKKARKKSSRVLENANLSELFGIDFDQASIPPVQAGKEKTKKAMPKTRKRTIRKQTAANEKSKPVAALQKKKADQKSAVKTAAQSPLKQAARKVNKVTGKKST